MKEVDSYNLLIRDYVWFNSLIWDDKHPKIVVWSGGADSTLVVAELAILCQAAGMPLYTMSVDVDYINPDKLRAEKKSRKRVLNLLKKKGFDVRDSHMDIKLDLEFYDEEDSNCRYSQQFLWEMIALQLAPRNADVFFGFILTDEIWRVAEKREQFFKFYNEWHYKNLRFHDPYAYQDKVKIFSKLHRLGFLDYVWTCEDPNGTKPCGYCTPCKHRRSALFELAMAGESWAKEILEKENKIQIFFS